MQQHEEQKEAELYTPYKDRAPVLSEIVHVYRNLNLHSTGFSVRCAKTKLVLCHCENVTLSECEFVVSEKSRQRVLKEGRRNVHAYVRGRLENFTPAAPDFLNRKIYYNPYKTANFIDCTKEEAIFEAGMVHFDGSFCFLLD